MPADPRIGEAMERFDRSVEEFTALVASMPEKEAAPGGEWSPRETAAHMIFWHNAVRQSLEAVAAGRTGTHPGTNFDELNARAVAEYAGRPKADLLKELSWTQDRIRELVKAQTNPDAVALVRQNGTPVTVVQWIDIFINHCDGHIAELKSKA